MMIAIKVHSELRRIGQSIARRNLFRRDRKSPGHSHGVWNGATEIRARIFDKTGLTRHGISYNKFLAKLPSQPNPCLRSSLSQETLPRSTPPRESRSRPCWVAHGDKSADYS